jgi:lipoprotein-anchoring transpeptidase ErfK/SrfK
VRRTGIWSHLSRGVIVAVLAGGLCVGLGLTVAGATRPWAASRLRAHTSATIVESAAAQLTARRAAVTAAVTFAPARASTNVALDTRVVVATRRGYLAAVHVVAAGKPLAGAMTAARTQWRSSAALDADSSYLVTAVVVAAGQSVETTSTFRTLAPSARIGATVFPNGGLSVGVAQPIVFRFGHPVDNAFARAALLQHLTITESRPVPGGWHWFNARELHFRPKTFWPKGEKVTVVSDLDGWNAGDGLWGTGASVVQFSTGDARVSVADLATDKMTVTDNGRVVATFPFSGGKPTDPTMNGVHIVLDRESVVRMISSSNGVPVNSPDGYDELVYSDVHISDSGEYVHAAPWSVRSQGRTNVSHGCVNLSPADALAFFAFSRVGDVVMVVGGPRPPARGDHGVMDWDTSWNQWTPAVVHGPVTPPPHRAFPAHGSRVRR